MRETDAEPGAALAADIGGTSIRAARVDADGRIVARKSGPTPADPREGLARLREFWKDLGPARAAALVVAGGIRTGTGEITQSPNLLRWEGSKPGSELGCGVLNDADGALLGEAWLGALRGRRSALLVTLGTGVRGGVLIDGRLWTGDAGGAGEIGHVTIHPDGPRCPCGNRGCLELYASASAVARAAGQPDARAAAEAARGGDAGARRAFDDAARALGIGLADVANLVNPEAICVGGGLAAAFDLLEERLEQVIRRRAFRLATERLVLTPASLGEDA
ncbi:MAG: ROK family protein, partial [Planctomycetota bacterium]